jgi:hypothetical protein
MSWLALLKNPLAWCLAAIVALVAAVAVARGQLDSEREAHGKTAAALVAEGNARMLAQHDLAGAVAANDRYAKAEEARRKENEKARIAAARIEAEQRARLAQLLAEKEDIDRAFKRFVDQFAQAPDACRRATQQMEVACAAFSDY